MVFKILHYAIWPEKITKDPRGVIHTANQQNNEREIFSKIPIHEPEHCIYFIKNNSTCIITINHTCIPVLNFFKWFIQ